MTENRITAVCLFRDRVEAQRAIDALKAASFREGQIGVVTQKHDENDGSKAVTGAAIGVATGAGVGAVWALGIAAALFPPLGVVAGGTLAAVLASAAAGAGIAGLVGALVGLGLPEHEAKYYADEINAGCTLVTVKSDGRYEEALAILREGGGFDMSTREGPSAMRGGRPAANPLS